MYIDPKDLSLQDAAGMQLANIIRSIPEGGGDSGLSMIEAELTIEHPSLNETKLTCNKTCAELSDKDVIIFYTQSPKVKVYYLCVGKGIPNLNGGTFTFVMVWNGNGSNSFVVLTGNKPDNFPTATVQA